MNSLALTVDCVPTALADLVVTDDEKKFTINSARTVDFSTLTIAPGTQTPNCNYDLTRTFTWSGLPSWMTTIANNRNEANAVLKYGPSTDHTYSSMDGKNITLQIRYRKTSLGADIDITKSIEF